MLWRVFAYWSPGLPRPTTIFTRAPLAGDARRAGHAERARSRRGRARGNPISRRSAAEQLPFQLPHRPLLRRLCVVPAAHVERPVGHEEPELVRGGPADVAGLATAALGGLRGRPLDRNDDVAEMRPLAWWPGEERSIAGRRCRTAIVVAIVRREGLRGEERKGQDVGR